MNKRELLDRIKMAVRVLRGKGIVYKTTFNLPKGVDSVSMLIPPQDTIVTYCVFIGPCASS